MLQHRIGASYQQPVGGFVVPKEFIVGCSLITIEKILGFKTNRLAGGVVVVQLDMLPAIHELEYFGDTRSPAHQFEEVRNKDISRPALNVAAFAYLQPTTKLVKVIPLDDPFSQRKENQEWPAGQGAMQYRLKDGIRKSATVIDLIDNYPNGTFNPK